MYSLGFSRRCSGSFPEQSNKMDERSATWRQTIKLSIFITESRLENRVAAGVTKMTGRGNQRIEDSKTASGIGVGRKNDQP